MTRADSNARAHRAILVVGVVALAAYSFWFLGHTSAYRRSVDEFRVLVLVVLYGAYALVTSIAVHRFENLRGGAIVCHALFIAAFALALYGLRVVGPH